MPLYQMTPARSSRAASVQARRGRSILIASAAVATLLAGTVACNPGNALKIPQPDNLNASSVNSAAALPALLAGTLSSFQIAFSGAADEGNGGHEGFVNLTGLFSDEMNGQETFPTRILIDGRQASAANATLKGYFIDLTSARAIADKTDSKYDAFAADSVGHGVALAIGGYTYIMFAEAYCEGIPVSTLQDNGSITYGQPLTREQLLQIAVQRFDSAITVATHNSDSTTINLARVGLGRALLDSNDDAAAAAAVATVPTAFAYDVGASTNSAVENNGIWTYTFNELGFSVSDTEGHNGLAFVSENDPRVPTIDLTATSGQVGTSGLGCPANCVHFIQQQLYATQSSPIPLATGIEAQLIIAEHLQRTGGGWVATLNALRATVPGLTPIAATGTPAGDVSLLFHERAFWMYLTGHRLGDLRRLIRQYSRPATAVFPVGIDVNGAAYGSDVNFNISEDEANNPNFHGCLNRNA
jgi:starch-binding outer membrane protein, SusD/RagB family